MPLQPLAQRDFSGGINMVANPYLVQPRQLLNVRNMLLDEHGSLSTRDGSLTVSTSPDTTNPLVYRGILNRVDGTSFPFALQNTGTQNVLYRTDTDPWTLVATTTTGFLIPQSVTAVDREVFALGYESPQTWDGTTYTPITALGGQTVPPGTQHIAFHLGSLWVWNTAPTTTVLDGPSSLRMSDAVNPTGSWPSANQSFIAKDDGQVGMGLSAYTIAETGISPTATLVAFKNYSAYQINGVFGAANFSVQRIKSDMGCLAPRSIQFVAGFGIIRLTHKGFALYNGVDDKLISEEIRPAIFGDPPGPLSHANGVSGINFAAVIRAASVQSQNPPLYVCAVPVSGNALTRVFIYDLIRKAWTICDYPTPFQSLALVTTPTTQPQVQAGTAASGQLIRLFGGDPTDNGTLIDWAFQMRPMSPTNLATEVAYFRRATLDVVYTPTQPVSVTVAPAGLGTFGRTATFSAPSTGSLWGSPTTIWGQFIWGAGQTVESRVSVDIMRTAASCALTVSGTGSVRVRGVTIQALSKPLTKARV
jgi:hypothetical protein